MKTSQLKLKERVKAGEISADEAMQELLTFARKNGTGENVAKQSETYGWLKRHRFSSVSPAPELPLARLEKKNRYKKKKTLSSQAA